MIHKNHGNNSIFCTKKRVKPIHRKQGLYFDSDIDILAQLTTAATIQNRVIVLVIICSFNHKKACKNTYFQEFSNFSQYFLEIKNMH